MMIASRTIVVLSDIVANTNALKKGGKGLRKCSEPLQFPSLEGDGSIRDRCNKVSIRKKERVSRDKLTTFG